MRFIDRMLLQYSVNELDINYMSIKTCFYSIVQIIIPWAQSVSPAILKFSSYFATKLISYVSDGILHINSTSADLCGDFISMEISTQC